MDDLPKYSLQISKLQNVKKKIVPIICFNPDLCIKNKILVRKYNNCYIFFHSKFLSFFFFLMYIINL